MPWPPSTNVYAGGRLGERMRAVKAYRETAHWHLHNARVPKLGLAVPLAVELVAHPPDLRRRDLSNLLKIAEDSLTHYGLLKDDRWVHDWHIRWGELVLGGRLAFTVRPLSESAGAPDPTPRPPS